MASLMLLLLACVTPISRTVEQPAPVSTVAPPPPTAAPTQAPTATSVPPTPTLPPPTSTAPAAPAPTIPVPTVPAPTATITVAATATPVPTPAATAGPDPERPPERDLFLQVRAPVSGSTVPEAAVVVYGFTVPGATVTVDGNPAVVDANGGFRAETQLEPGVNTFQVSAADQAGNLESATIVVTSLALEPRPFLLVVTEPRDQIIVMTPNLPVEGYTGSRAVVSVEGVSVPVDPFGAFSATITLEPGPNIIDVLATNDDGQVRSVVVAVIYRPPGN